MIQRIQSVYLLVVTILMVVCMCSPVGSIIANTQEISEFGNLCITLPDGTKYRDDNGNYNACNETYEFVKALEKEIDLPKNIHVYDGRDIENQHTFYEYQFLLNHYTIVPGMPKEAPDEVILISNTMLKMPISYIEIELDSNAYVYIKGVDLQRAAMNLTELFQ